MGVRCAPSRISPTWVGWKRRVAFIVAIRRRAHWNLAIRSHRALFEVVVRPGAEVVVAVVLAQAPQGIDEKSSADARFRAPSAAGRRSEDGYNAET